jgi:hypothetical protein
MTESGLKDNDEESFDSYAYIALTLHMTTLALIIYVLFFSKFSTRRRRGKVLVRKKKEQEIEIHIGRFLQKKKGKEI